MNFKWTKNADAKGQLKLYIISKTGAVRKPESDSFWLQWWWILPPFRRKTGKIFSSIACQVHFGFGLNGIVFSCSGNKNVKDS